jgi:hypothetical protein
MPYEFPVLFRARRALGRLWRARMCRKRHKSTECNHTKSHNHPSVCVVASSLNLPCRAPKVLESMSLCGCSSGALKSYQRTQRPGLVFTQSNQSTSAACSVSCSPLAPSQHVLFIGPASLISACHGSLVWPVKIDARVCIRSLRSAVRPTAAALPVSVRGIARTERICVSMPSWGWIWVGFL